MILIGCQLGGIKSGVKHTLTWNSFLKKHVSSKIQMVYHISEVFTQFGWAPILILPTHYYPDLVHEFYASIVNKASNSGKLVNS